MTNQLNSRSTEQDFSPQEFWAFSLLFYQLDDNQKVLLRLQDEANLNVNQCLLIFFLLEIGYVLNHEQCNRLNRVLRESELKTNRLRTKRKEAGANGKTSQQYHDALQTEIASEKIQQEVLIGELNAFSQLDLAQFNFFDKEIVDYVASCLRFLFQCRLNDKSADPGQSVYDCIEVGVNRLVCSYLRARPFNASTALDV